MSPTAAAFLLSTVIKHHLLQGAGPRATMCLAFNFCSNRNTMSSWSYLLEWRLSCKWSSCLFKWKIDRNIFTCVCMCVVLSNPQGALQHKPHSPTHTHLYKALMLGVFYRTLSTAGNLFQYLAQGLFGMWHEGARDQTSNILFSGRPAQLPEPLPPINWCLQISILFLMAFKSVHTEDEVNFSGTNFAYQANVKTFADADVDRCKLMLGNLRWRLIHTIIKVWVRIVLLLLSLLKCCSFMYLLHLLCLSCD